MKLDKEKLNSIDEFLKFLRKRNANYTVDLLFPIVNRLRIEPDFIPDYNYSDTECVGWVLIKKLAQK